MKKASVLVFATFLFIQTLAQNRYLVSSLSEFNEAVNQVEPGDEIVLEDGTWTDVELSFTANGTEGDSITLTAETPGGVVFTGRSNLEIAGDYLVVKDLDFNAGQTSGSTVISFRRNSSQIANHSRLTNCRIINYNPPSDELAYKWVSLYGEYNRVDHCSFMGKNHEGALLVVWLSGTENNHRIDHNYFANIPELGRNGAETIRIGTSTNSMTVSKTIVEYNLFESCDGEIEIISNKSGFNVYRYNTFQDSEGTLTLRHGNDCEVYGNFFFGENKRSGGVRIIGERHKVYNNYFEGLQGNGFRAALSMTNGVPNSALNRYFQVKNSEVVNNTFIACEEPFTIGAGKSDELSLPPIDNTIANNVIYASTGSRAFTYTDIPTNMLFLTNFVEGNIGIEADGIINGDPLMEEGNDLYRPSDESPLLDGSTGAFDYIIADIDGHTRDQSPDIGCDEESNQQIINRPLLAEDVGFDWSDDSQPVLSTQSDRKSNIRITSKLGDMTIHGLEEDQFPVRLKLYNLNGQLILDVTNKSARLNVDIEGVFIAVLLDASNKILHEEKIILKQ